MRDITVTQKVTLELIKHFYTTCHYPPTIRDLAVIVGVSPKAMQDRLNAMRKKNLFEHKNKLIPKGINITFTDGEKNVLPV